MTHDPSQWPSRRGDAALFAALALISLVPLACVEVPPIVDYPNHLARLAVLAGLGSDPELSRIYAAHWAVIPNLGIDLLMPWALAFLPLHVAGRAMLALTMLLPVIGTIAYSRALFGGASRWPFAAFLVSGNLAFLLGFANLLLSYGAALLAAALFHATGRRRPALSHALAAIAAIAIFFIHLGGCFLLLALVFAQDIVDAMTASNRWRALATRGAGCLAVLAGPLLLYRAAPLSQATQPAVWLPAADKARFALSPVLGYVPLLDLATAAGLVAVFALCLARGRVRAAAAPLAVFAALALAYPFAPSAALGGTYLETRIAVALGFLAFCLFVPQALPRRVATAITLLVLGLFIARTATLAAVWYGHRADLEETRQAIAPIVPGSRVLVVAVQGPGAHNFMVGGDPALLPDAPRSRFLSLIGYPTYFNMAALVTIERHAFFPYLFTAADKQPITVLAPYRDLAVPVGVAPRYQGLAAPGYSAADLALFPYFAHWRERFDYVLVLNAGLAGDLHSFLPDRLVFLRQTGFAALFEVRRPS